MLPTFIYTGAAYSAECIYLCCSNEGERVFASRSDVIVYDPRNPSGRWRRYRFDKWIACVCVLSHMHDPVLDACALAFDSEFLGFGPKPIVEEIVEAEGEYMSWCCQQGSCILACTSRGKIFKRQRNNTWSLEGDITTLFPSTPSLSRIIALNEQECIIIGGLPLVGFIVLGNDRGFSKVNTPPVGMLTGVFLQDNELLICGWNGIVLTGNLQAGFKIIHSGTGHVFTDVCRFQNEIYLSASKQGLFRLGTTLEAVEPRQLFSEGVLNLSPTPRELIVTCPSKICVFDGRNWRDIPLPQDWPE